MLPHQEGIVFEQRALHVLAFAGGMALVQCRQNRHCAEHPPHHVVHRRACAQRTETAPGHISKTAHHLHHLIETGAMLVRSGQEALQRAVNNFRVQFFQRRITKTQLVHSAGAEVFNDHVGTGDQLQYQFATFSRLEVDGDAFFVAVIGREESRTRCRQLARVIAVERFDLDHFGAEVGEHQTAGRAHHHMAELDDTDALERKLFGHCHFAVLLQEFWKRAINRMGRMHRI